MTSNAPDARTAGSAFAWLGAALFAAALGWFVYSYFVRFPALVPSGGTAEPLVWNLALFTAFAAHHSLFARDAVRVRIERAFAGRERSVFVWVASVLFMRSAARGAPCREPSGPSREWRVESVRRASRRYRAHLARRRHPRRVGNWQARGRLRHAPGAIGGDATFTRRAHTAGSAIRSTPAGFSSCSPGRS
jgi:hypothetical protein